MRAVKPVWTGKLLRGVAARAESRKHYRSRTAEFTAEK
jgi:hypothetical protein